MRADPWLADRFGHSAWWVPSDATSDAIRTHAAAHAPAFYQSKVEAIDVTAVKELGRGGMSVVDTNVTLARPPTRSVTPEFSVVEAEAEDRDEVLEIAERDYRVSRFHMDPDIPAEVANRIKRDWAAAYLDRERGDRLLVVRRNGRLAGFLAILASGRTRVIDLIAVRDPERGAGVGTALVVELLADPGGDCESVEVGTQAANTNALRFYETLGFRAVRTQYVLHLLATET